MAYIPQGTCDTRESRPLLLAAPSLLHAALGLRSSAIHILGLSWTMFVKACQHGNRWQPTEPSKLPRKRARRERERERERREREERESSKRERREREPSNLPQHYKSYCVTAALSPRLLHSRASSLAARAPESCRPDAECTFAEYSRAASFTWTSKNIK